MYWLGYKRAAAAGPFENVDGCVTDVLTTVPAASITTDADPTMNLCLAVLIVTGDPVTDPPTVTVETKDCATASRYLCKFSYSKNSIIFVSPDTSASDLTWYQAEEDCQMKGGHLASIHDAAEKSIFNCLLTQK